MWQRKKEKKNLYTTVILKHFDYQRFLYSFHLLIDFIQIYFILDILLYLKMYKVRIFISSSINLFEVFLDCMSNMVKSEIQSVVTEKNGEIIL